LPSLNLTVSATLKMPERRLMARTWAAWKLLLSGVRGVAALAPRTAQDHHRAVPTPNATTARRSGTLPATAKAVDALVLAPTSVALNAGSAPTQATVTKEEKDGHPLVTTETTETRETTETTETTEITETEIMVIGVVQGARNEAMVVNGTSGRKESVAHVQAKIAPREAP